jgi:hypothetical protein
MAKEPIILTDQIIPPPALVRAGLLGLPAAIAAQSERACRRFIEFFLSGQFGGESQTGTLEQLS